MGPDWDNVIALNYAAEQLCMASQLLTSDRIPVRFAVQQTCDRHLRGLLQHSGLLPEYLNTWIRECLRDCDRIAGAGAVSDEKVRELAATINIILNDVRGVIARLSTGDENAA
jgi:hypothetical protein